MESNDASNFILYLLLLAALAVGWWLGRRSNKSVGSVFGLVSRKTPTNDYFIGLNYLLNDEPDDAIDIFIDSLEISSNTLETHLALGTLLRRRGKVDRSIALYQDLLGKSNFSRTELNEIKISLVQSYISAGLLDRAEHLLKELRNEKGDIKVQALVLSANVYQMEKDWQEGVNALLELLKMCPSSKRSTYQNLASHFYCEMAEEALENEHMSRARDYLRNAVALDKNNARVSILFGRLEGLCGNYKEAIVNYLRVKKQDASFMADVFAPLVECFQQAGKEKALRNFIDESIQEESNTSVLLELAKFLEQERGQEEARNYLLQRLGSKSSLRLLLQTLALDDASGRIQEDKQLFLRVLKENIEGKAQYQCTNCGLEMKSLLWHCPSCSQWGNVKHVVGISGE
ncbi:MAG: hypothetical protein P8M72_12460 [Gammaproteobacteria bacterium]|nr:hypothetical protein [Gammaproteobacteria bacterium]